MKTYIPHIAFEVTHDCNLNCQFCYNIWKAPKRVGLQKKYSFDSAIKTLQKLFEIANIRQIAFVGGEPTICDKFEELVQFCCENEKMVTVISNGYQLTKNKIKSLLNLGVYFFQFPIFSDRPDIHDLLTGISGSWDNSVKSIDCVMKNNGRVIPLIVITKENILGIKSTIEYLYEKGFKEILINRFNIGGTGIKNRFKLMPTMEELVKGIHAINACAKKYSLKIISMVAIPYCFINPDDYPYIEFNSCPENILNRPLTVDFEGDFRICSHSPKIVGNIFIDDLEEMLTSDYVSSWKKTKPDLCKDCGKFTFCMAGCRAASEQLGFGLDREDPIIDRIILKKSKLLDLNKINHIKN